MQQALSLIATFFLRFMGALFAACGITRSSSSTSSEVGVDLANCISEETTPKEVVSFALDAIDDTEVVTLGQDPGGRHCRHISGIRREKLTCLLKVPIVVVRS